MKAIIEKAGEYQRTYAIVGRGHYLAADRFARRNRWLGIPVVVISVVIGTTIFGTLNQNPDMKWKIVAGFISMTGAVLSALQTSLGFAQVSERHRSTAAHYRAIKRRLELFLLRFGEADASQGEAAIAELSAINQVLSDLAAESPSLPDACYDLALREHEGQQKK